MAQPSSIGKLLFRGSGLWKKISPKLITILIVFIPGENFMIFILLYNDFKKYFEGGKIAQKSRARRKMLS